MTYVPPGVTEEIEEERGYERIVVPEELEAAIRADGFSTRWRAREDGTRTGLYFRGSGTSGAPELLWTRQDLDHLPGLLIPIRWGPDGDVVGYQIRADNPKPDVNGVLRRYRSPFGSQFGVLDCPPRMWALVQDPTRPLYVTEGVKKADALASIGAPCIALLGVNGWSAPRPKRPDGKPLGERKLSEQWADVPLKAREVVIVFDSDVSA